MQVAEKVYSNRETEEENEQRKKEKQQGRNLQRVLTLRLEDEYKLFETLDRAPQDLDWWFEAFTPFPRPGLRWQGWGGPPTSAPSIHVELRAQASLVSVHQYLISREAQDRIRTHITRLLE